MKKYINFLPLVLLTLVLLNGCSTFQDHLGNYEQFSEEECMQINFHQMGFNDGRIGRAKRNLENYEDKHGCRVPVNYAAYNAGWKKGLKGYCNPTFMMGMVNGRTGHRLDNVGQRNQMCHQHGLSFDVAQYHKGQDRGIKQYCTVERGWHIGVRGKPYPDTCPSYLKNQFRTGWESGVRHYCSNNQAAKKIGEKGKPYPSICSPKLYPNFKNAHAEGIEKYLEKAK